MSKLGRAARRKEVRRRLTDPSLDPRLPKNMANFRKQYHENVTAHVGVLCLSEVRDDLLMWAHYADSHRGICFVFDGADPVLASAQPVRYQRARPTVNPLIHTKDEMLDSALFTKSDHWAYEKEWRLIQYKRGPGTYTISPAALTQVILGAQISDDDRAQVHEWLRGLTHRPRIYQASLSKTSFSIEMIDA
jgi:hypothetical protein